MQQVCQLVIKICESLALWKLLSENQLQVTTAKLKQVTTAWLLHAVNLRMSNTSKDRGPYIASPKTNQKALKLLLRLLSLIPVNDMTFLRQSRSVM